MIASRTSNREMLFAESNRKPANLYKFNMKFDKKTLKINKQLINTGVVSPQTRLIQLFLNNCAYLVFKLVDQHSALVSCLVFCKLWYAVCKPMEAWLYKARQDRNVAISSLALFNLRVAYSQNLGLKPWWEVSRGGSVTNLSPKHTTMY